MINKLKKQNKKLKKEYKEIFYKLVDDNLIKWNYKHQCSWDQSWVDYTGNGPCDTKFLFTVDHDFLFSFCSGIDVTIGNASTVTLNGLKVLYYKYKIKRKIKRDEDIAKIGNINSTMEEKLQCLKILTDDN